MPLEGDLKVVNLSSVLQLIMQEQQNGVLKIRRKSEIIDIGFLEGQVTGAFYERGDKVERLESYFVKSGIVGQNVYDMVEEINKETGRPIMNILLEDKYLTQEEVERIIRFKIEEVFDDIFIWQEGQFKFEHGSVIYPKSTIKIRMDTQSLILESARRFDEWQKISAAIPSDDIVYKRIERPELKLQLSDAEVRMLSLLNGHRSIEDLVQISGLGKFQSYNCLYRLLSQGQIELAYAKPKVQAPRTTKRRSWKFLLLPLGIAGIIAVLVVEFLLGNSIAKRHLFSFHPLNQEVYTIDYTGYQTIFFFKHSRTPSVQEVQQIFNR